MTEEKSFWRKITEDKNFLRKMDEFTRMMDSTRPENMLAKHPNTVENDDGSITFQRPTSF